MQAYAEGFDIPRNKDSKDLPEDERFALNMPDIVEVWRRGSVISSWLLDLGAAALAKDAQLTDFSGFVRIRVRVDWTVEARFEESSLSPATCFDVSSMPASARGRTTPIRGKDALGQSRSDSEAIRVTSRSTRPSRKAPQVRTGG